MTRWTLTLWLLVLVPAARGGIEDQAPPATPEKVKFGAVRGGAAYAVAATPVFIKGEFTADGVKTTGVNLNGQILCLDFPPRWKVKGNTLSMVHCEPGTMNPRGVRARNVTLATVSLDEVVKKAFAKKPHKGGKFDDFIDFTFGDESFSTTLPVPNTNTTTPPIAYVYNSMCDFVDDKYTYQVLDEKFPFSHYEFFYDLIIEKEDACNFFILASGPLQLAMNDTNKGAGKGAPSWRAAQDPLKPMMGFWHLDAKWRWVMIDQFEDPPFNERFHAFVKGTTYFFLTDSGKVYVSKKPAKGEREMEVLWDNERHPITAALEDADAGKVFLFGKANKGDMLDKDFYWELDEKVQCVDYDPSAVKPVKTVEPLKTVMEYARFLADEKKIKLEKK
jgi:hypothetical protein